VIDDQDGAANRHLSLPREPPIHLACVSPGNHASALGHRQLDDYGGRNWPRVRQRPTLVSRMR
jgi:hypothetical protein